MTKTFMLTQERRGEKNNCFPQLLQQKVKTDNNSLLDNKERAAQVRCKFLPRPKMFLAPRQLRRRFNDLSRPPVFSFYSPAAAFDVLNKKQKDLSAKRSDLVYDSKMRFYFYFPIKKWAGQ